MPNLRYSLLLLIVLVGIIGPFLLWGQQFEDFFSLKGTQQWLLKYGDVAWLAAILLLMADLFLPIPGTVVMSALGLTYGWLLGGLVSSIGSVSGALLAYILCRSLGRKVACYLVDAASLDKSQAWFKRGQAEWWLALSRWLPVMPEVLSCLAGLNKMPCKRFIIAISLGSVPLGFSFAAIGAMGGTQPALALFLSALLPAILYTVAMYLTRLYKS